MQSFEKYPSYKDSGTEWLGEIPSQWNVVPGLSFLYESKEKNTGMKRNEVLSLSYGKIRVKGKEELTGLVPESFETYQLVNEGDIIFRPTDLQNDKVSLRSAISEHQGIITSAYLNLGVKKTAHSKFYHYLFRTIDNNKVIYGLGSGLRQNISFLDFRRFTFPFPSLPEQTAIAKFLDEKTEKIDQAIAQKQALIQLLKERKQILIQQAVTKGLNPDAPMKDSGIDWIGEIPEHWEVKRLKHSVFNIISGPFGSSLVKDEYVKEGYKIYGQEQVIPNDLTIGDYYISQRKFESMRRYEVFEGDVLVSCVGTFGKIAVVPKEFERGIINPRLIKMTPVLSLISSKFLHETLLSSFCFKQFDMYSRGGTMGVINIDLLSKLILFVPPLKEQEEILNHIVCKRAQLTESIGLQERQIEQLKEYKSVLIDSAVTGKIKVV